MLLRAISFPTEKERIGLTWKYLKKYLHFAVLAPLFSGVLTLIGTLVMMLHYSTQFAGNSI